MKRTETRPELIRWVGPWAAMAIAVGTMIGTGIFLKPAEMAAAAGSKSLVYAAWLAAAALSLSGALVYCELAVTLPEAGGNYAYLRRAFGPVWGFLYGWTHSVLSGPASKASMAAGMARFCSYLAPGIAAPVWTLQRQDVHIAVTGAGVLAVLAIVALTSLNYFGLRLGGRVQVFLTAAKLGSLALIIILAFFLIGGDSGPSAAPPNPLPSSAGSFAGFLAAIAAAIWTFDGWQELVMAGSEVEDPRHNVVRALVGGVVIVGAIYLLFNGACFHVLPFDRIAASPHVASDVMARFSSGSAAGWVTLMMAVAALGSLNSSILTAARIPYAMARDGLFFRPAAAIHSRHHTPAGALVFEASMASLFALTGTFEGLTSLFVFAQWIFYGLAGAALCRLRSTEPDLPRPYRCWGYPWLPTLYMAGALALSLSIWLKRPLPCTLGVALMLSGLFFYRYWHRRLEAKVTLRWHRLRPETRPSSSGKV